MKIAIFGSTGFLGKALLNKALEKGYQVQTLVRNPAKLGEFKQKVEFVQGNIFNVEDIQETVVGTEAVLSAVGPPQKKTGKPEVYKTAMENLVSILEKQGIKRFIHTGGAVHPGGENENWSMGRRMIKIYLTLFAKPILEAKYLEWEVLKKSSLDWTLVRPPQIINGASKGELIADEKNLARTKVYVEDLAEFILNHCCPR